MDGVGTEFILNTNSEIIKPDLQLAVIADEKILQERLSERDVLTRFEKENQSKRELDFMEKGVRELGKHNIDIMNIYNNDNLDIYVYRRKRIDEYINEVERIIKRLL